MMGVWLWLCFRSDSLFLMIGVRRVIRFLRAQHARGGPLDFEEFLNETKVRLLFTFCLLCLKC
jgi:hypothetical protein